MKYVLSIDQSTSGAKAALIDGSGRIVRRCGMRHAQYYPQSGYVEHDAEEIFQNTVRLIGQALEDIPARDVAALSIANQRETTVLWDRTTGRPLRRAIVWQDVRAGDLCRELNGYAAYVRDTTGLELSPYYSAAKAAHALRETPLKNACLGTVESYLIYRLTGAKVHASDMTNASRTQLMDLKKLRWDEKLCEIFAIPMSMLPEYILPCDADFGRTACPGVPDGLKITGVMGDSHASLFGHGCLSEGMVKTSYGTGSSIMMNVGARPVFSQNGLSASVGFARGGQVHYVLEGNITCSADTLIWLRDQVNLIADVSEVESIARSVSDTQNVYLVPAFSGLGAPYFDSGARAALVGMNRGTTRAHIVRAALESIAHQNADVLRAMSRDAARPIHALHADGGGSVNALLMQTQADLVPCRVECAREKELTALGVGMMGGMAAGLFESFIPQAPRASYAPLISEQDRLRARAGWADAVRRVRSVPYAG